MSDYNESSRRRDRHRRQKNPNSRNSAGNPQREQNFSPREERAERRPENFPSPKLPTHVCVKCGEPIQDITSALADKGGGGPIHFDCVLSFLQGAENLGANEKIVYIGQGRFAVVLLENPAETRKFKIMRTIEWEAREKKAEWRSDISELFSQVK